MLEGGEQDEVGGSGGNSARSQHDEGGLRSGPGGPPAFLGGTPSPLAPPALSTTGGALRKEVNTDETLHHWRDVATGPNDEGQLTRGRFPATANL